MTVLDGPNSVVNTRVYRTSKLKIVYARGYRKPNFNITERLPIESGYL